MFVNYKTIQGRRPGPHLLITAGVHGDEWEPIVAARELATQMNAGEFAGLLTIVPIANERAYRSGRRVGEDGLDLARTCPGRADGSTTERIAHELSALIREADYYIDLHTGGLQLQIWPLAGYMMHSDVRVLDAQRRMARAFGLPVVWGTDPSLQGRTLSVARDVSIPAIYVEYLGSSALESRSRSGARMRLPERDDGDWNAGSHRHRTTCALLCGGQPAEFRSFANMPPIPRRRIV